MSTSDENSPTPESPNPTGNAYEDAYKAVLEEEEDNCVSGYDMNIFMGTIRDSR